MLTTVLVTSTLAAIAALCGMVYAFAVKTAPRLEPVTVYPFAPGSANPADDTLCGQEAAATVLTDDGWQSATLMSLSHVEDLLDSLEMHGVTEREVQTIGNAEFRVRWRV